MLSFSAAVGTTSEFSPFGGIGEAEQIYRGSGLGNFLHKYNFLQSFFPSFCWIPRIDMQYIGFQMIIVFCLILT